MIPWIKNLAIQVGPITKTHKENVYYNQLYEYNDDGSIMTI